MGHNRQQAFWEFIASVKTPGVTPSSTKIVMTDIVINPDLPDSLFDITPPLGYSILKTAE